MRKAIRFPSIFSLVFGVQIALTVIFVLIPALIVIIIAFTGDDYPVFPPRSYSIRWFGDISSRFISAFVTSAVVALISTVAASVLGVPAALAIVRGRFPGKGLVDAFLRSPLQLPGIVTGIAFLQFYALLHNFSDLSLTGTSPGLILAHISITTPYILAAVAARLTKFDRTVEEAAYGLGASPMRTFFSVTMPIIRPALFAGAFFAFIVSFDNVPMTIFLVGTTTTLPVELFTAVDAGIHPRVFVVSTLVIVFATLFTLLVEKAVGLRRLASG